MRESRRNADFMSPGMVDKINKALQLREMICKSAFEQVSNSIFAKGLCSSRQLYGYFHIKKAPCLTKQEKPGEFSSALPAFPGGHGMALGGTGDIHHWGSGREGPPGW